MVVKFDKRKLRKVKANKKENKTRMSFSLIVKDNNTNVILKSYDQSYLIVGCLILFFLGLSLGYQLFNEPSTSTNDTYYKIQERLYRNGRYGAM